MTNRTYLGLIDDAGCLKTYYVRRNGDQVLWRLQELEDDLWEAGSAEEALKTAIAMLEAIGSEVWEEAADIYNFGWMLLDAPPVVIDWPARSLYAVDKKPN